MIAYILRRLLYVMPALFGVITLSFLLIHLIPGDAVDFALGEQADPRDKQALQHELGLDQSLAEQYFSYLTHVAQLDLGRSLYSRQLISRDIASYFPATVELSICALALALLWGLPLGVLTAAFPHPLMDGLAETLGLLGVCVPGVVLGPALVYLFAMRLGWFPVSERGGLDHLILPAVSLAIPLGAVIFRMTKTAMLEVVREDYVRTARAKGVPETRIYFVHALRNALMPIITIVGLQAGALLTGTVVTETIFDWPGIGNFLYLSVQRRDYPAVQSCVLFVACIYVAVNLLTDLVYAVANPRVKLESPA